jgi:NAD(P)H-dependent FMN reductase
MTIFLVTSTIMRTIAIISPSVRRGRNSHRVALYLKKYLEDNKLAAAEILDLREYNFPLFDERLRHLPDPAPEILQFAQKIGSADGVIIVAPEYNGGYPASLKNVIDLLTDEWRKKPVAISTVSDGSFGGTQVITALQFSLWKIRAWTVPAMFPVPKVRETFDEEGTPADPEVTGRRASAFINELMWCIEAKERMKG